MLNEKDLNFYAKICQGKKLIFAPKFDHLTMLNKKFNFYAKQQQDFKDVKARAA